MTSSRRVLALATILAVVSSGAVRASDGPDPTDDAARSSRDPTVAIDTLRALLDHDVAASAVPESAVPSDVVEATQTITDPVGDAPPRGDVTGASATAGADGIVRLTVQVVQFTQPFGADWEADDTAALWDIDTWFDEYAEYTAVFTNVGGDVVAGVLTPDLATVVCAATPTWDAASSTYAVQFPASCIDDPSAFRWAAAMSYEDVAGGTSTIDWAPDTTWAGPVANDAVRPIVTVTPDRYYDSRRGDGPRPSNSITPVQIAGVRQVPAGAKGAVLNVTAVDATEPGFMTVYPCDQGVPAGSNVNFWVGQTVPNAVFAPLAADGRVCVYTFGSAGLIVDVNGYLPANSDIFPVAGDRVYDSRNGDGPRPDGSITQVVIPDVLPFAVSAAILNVTAVDPLASGFMTVFPCGSPVPVASNLNFVTGLVAPNAVVARLGPGSTVCVYTNGSAGLIVDLNGLVPSWSRLVALQPARVYDSRETQHGAAKRPAASITEVQVAGVAGVPSDARTAVLNVTADQTDAPGFVTVFPCGEPLPEASNLNYVGGQTIPNAVVAKIGTAGRVCLYTYAGTHLIADVNGYVP